jgi:hypothetical protein
MTPLTPKIPVVSVISMEPRDATGWSVIPARLTRIFLLTESFIFSPSFCCKVEIVRQNESRSLERGNTSDWSVAQFFVPYLPVDMINDKFIEVMR